MKYEILVIAEVKKNNDSVFVNYLKSYQSLTDLVTAPEECIMIQDSQPSRKTPPIRPSIQSEVSSVPQCNETHANSSVINVVILRGMFN